MKKLLAILLAVILVLGLSACGSGNVNWQDFKVDGETYKVGVNKDSGITIVENTSVEYLLYFYKDGEKLLGSAASILTGSLASVQQEMEKGGTLVEQRSDKNATYTIYKNNDKELETTYFVIVDFLDKDGFMSFETKGELEEIKEIYDVISAK